MNDIQVGDFIKDKENNITKVIGILSLFKDVYLYLGEDGYQYSDNAIIKHSLYITDLLSINDYINGERIQDITGNYIKTDKAIHNKFWLSNNVKSIKINN